MRADLWEPVRTCRAAIVARVLPVMRWTRLESAASIRTNAIRTPCSVSSAASTCSADSAVNVQSASCIISTGTSASVSHHCCATP